MIYNFVLLGKHSANKDNKNYNVKQKVIENKTDFMQVFIKKTIVESQSQDNCSLSIFLYNQYSVEKLLNLNVIKTYVD